MVSWGLRGLRVLKSAGFVALDVAEAIAHWFSAAMPCHKSPVWRAMCSSVEHNTDLQQAVHTRMNLRSLLYAHSRACCIGASDEQVPPVSGQ